MKRLLSADKNVLDFHLVISAMVEGSQMRLRNCNHSNLGLYLSVLRKT